MDIAESQRLVCDVRNREVRSGPEIRCADIAVRIERVIFDDDLITGSDVLDQVRIITAERPLRDITRDRRLEAGIARERTGLLAADILATEDRTAEGQDVQIQLGIEPDVRACDAEAEVRRGAVHHELLHTRSRVSNRINVL